MTAPAVVMTTDESVVALHVPVSPATLLLPAATLGVMDAAKKPEGYVSVMVPPGGMKFVGVKPSVSTATFPAFRSEVAIIKLLSFEAVFGFGSASIKLRLIEIIARRKTKRNMKTLGGMGNIQKAQIIIGAQTPQIIIAATSPCVRFVLLVHAFFSKLGIWNPGAGQLQKSFVPINADPLDGADIHDGHSQVKPEPYTLCTQVAG
jgi:hypothetical protein